MHVGQHPQSIVVKGLVTLEVRYLDAQQVLDRPRHVVTLTNLLRRLKGALETPGRLSPMLRQANGNEHRDAATDRAAIDDSPVAANNTGVLESLDASKTGRR